MKKTIFTLALLTKGFIGSAKDNKFNTNGNLKITMKKTVLSLLMILAFGFGVKGQENPINGALNHTNGYFTMRAYNASYDDGSFSKIFYDGNKKTINFWNSDSNTIYSNIRVGNAHGSFDHTNGYFTMRAYNASYDDGSFSKIFYDGKKKTINFWNSDSNTPYTNIRVANITAKGRVHCEEVLVDLKIPADYVFEKYYEGTSKLKSSYTMPTLEEVEAFTKKNHHLPAMPSAAQIREEGLQLKEMTNLLLQKVEELTLYTIEQEKRIKSLEAQLGKQ
ncbi:hypothetical protein ABW636_12590 [Aquimarina sp. 2201CG1-2-11]|uniref:hypothetical protein n=1 Tax=Aquimarina discodermiae TaxID=3231043 RepID=UPI003461BD42